MTAIALRRRRRAFVALPVLVAGGVAVPAAVAAGRTVPRVTHAALEMVKVSGDGTVLANAAGDSLYALSSERNGKVTCTGACAGIWPPVLVKRAVAHLALGTGVRGRIGFVAHSATMKQVTFNGYPLYRYSGDTGPRQGKGEGISANGGTWSLVRPGARTAAATLVISASTTSTKKTSGGSGGGW